jgi:hypothetical protein
MTTPLSDTVNVAQTGFVAPINSGTASVVDLKGGTGGELINTVIWPGYSANVFTAQICQNFTYEWTIGASTTSAGAVAHPYHHHVNHFQVVTGSSTGMAVRTGEWRDVIPSFGTKMRLKPHSFIGSVIIHCHLLQHEDLGMMGLMKILDFGLQWRGPEYLSSSNAICALGIRDHNHYAKSYSDSFFDHSVNFGSNNDHSVNLSSNNDHSVNSSSNNDHSVSSNKYSHQRPLIIPLDLSINAAHYRRTVHSCSKSPANSRCPINRPTNHFNPFQ